VTSDWTPLDVYLYTVEHIGVPAKTHYDIKTGQITCDGPFTPLKPDELERVLRTAREARS
jgi:hypothetical protein